jgi:hypothetical protein
MDVPLPMIPYQTIIFRSFYTYTNHSESQSGKVGVGKLNMVDDKELMMFDSNQQPLTWSFSKLAIRQIQGQHSGFILLKYFKQARSAAVSDPEDSAAFLQTG